jgi:ABC-type antimicrobial peptide transport system permease subunit
MVLYVLERRQEIGLRRAVGTQRRDIASLVIVESTVIGLIGGVLGLCAAVIGVSAVTVVRHGTPTSHIRLNPVALADGTVVGLLGGAVAGNRGSRIATSEALRW